MKGATEVGAGSAWAVGDEVSLPPRPCMMKPPSPFVEVAEALVVGGLATTVTKLCLVKVIVESVSVLPVSCDEVVRGPWRDWSVPFAAKTL